MSRRYGRRAWSDRRRPFVLDVAPGLVHESGPEISRDGSPERVAVMAHWSTDPVPSRSVVAMLRELDSGGFATVLVSAAEVEGPLGRVCTWAPGAPAMPEATTVLRRANVGYDFGSWAAVLAAHPGVSGSRQVLLVNDSLVGPFAPLELVLRDFDQCPMPVWGLSGSLQHRAHVQSFFVGFTDGILGHPALRAFWSDIRVESRKAKVVRFNELALSEALEDAGIGWTTMFAPKPGGPPNPSVDDWKRLLCAGVPFLKAELVVSPPDHVADWNELAPTLQDLHRQDPGDWVPPESVLGPPARESAWRRVPRRARTILDIDGPDGLRRAAGARLRRRLG